VHNLDVPSVPDFSVVSVPLDITPLCWAVAGSLCAFTLCILLLVPFALFGKGTVGENARLLLRDLLAVFHAALDLFKGRGEKR
jgi:cytochrome c biogenesis protein CcdA